MAKRKAKARKCEAHRWEGRGFKSCRRTGPIRTDGGRDFCETHANAWAGEIIAVAIKPHDGFTSEQRADFLWAARRMAAGLVTAVWERHREEQNA